MKRLKILLTFLIIFSFTPIHLTLAQETDNVPIEIEQEEEEEFVIKEGEETEQEDTLQGTLQQEEQPRYSLGTILLTILIPLIFVVLIYLTFKFIKF